MQGQPSDSGLTLIEMLVALSLLVVALAMFSGSLWVSHRAQLADTEYSVQNDSMNLAFQALDRQIRSGYVAGVDSGPTGADQAVRIYTEAQGEPQCVMWVLASPVSGRPQALYVTSWWPARTPPTTAPVSFDASTTGVWRTVVEGVWNKLLNKQGFSLVSPTGGVLGSLQVDLWLNEARVRDSWWTDAQFAASLDRAKRQAVEVTSFFTSRNAPRADENPFGVSPAPSPTPPPTKGGTTGVCGA